MELQVYSISKIILYKYSVQLGNCQYFHCTFFHFLYIFSNFTLYITKFVLSWILFLNF